MLILVIFDGMNKLHVYLKVPKLLNVTDLMYKNKTKKPNQKKTT